VRRRVDFTATELRREVGRSRDANQARRLLALATIYAGGSRGEAARIGGVGLHIVRDWVVRFNAHEPAGLVDRKPPGPSPRLNDTQQGSLGTLQRFSTGPPPVRCLNRQAADLPNCRSADIPSRVPQWLFFCALKPAFVWE
jgi:hypothetical protein